MIATYRAHTPGNTVGFEKQTEAVANLLSQYIQEEEEVAQSIEPTGDTRAGPRERDAVNGYKKSI